MCIMYYVYYAIILVYYGIFINAFYVYIIIKMPPLLVLSVNNRYTELIRANIRYGNIRERGNIFNEV